MGWSKTTTEWNCLFADKIISLDLNVKEVYEQSWKKDSQGGDSGLTDGGCSSDSKVSMAKQQKRELITGRRRAKRRATPKK